MTKIAIIADDFGLTDGVCQGILELFEHGAISGTSLMTAAPGALDRALAFRLHEQAPSVGTHLQLTGGSPLAPRERVPSLVDVNTGEFRSKTDAALADPSEARLEWETQISETRRVLGAAPAHLDCHHGFNRQLEFQETFIQLAVRNGTAIRSGSDSLDSLAVASGLTEPAHAVRGWTGRDLGIDDLKMQILDAREEHPGRSLVVVSHPGHVDEHLRAISSLNDARANDMSVLIDLAETDWLDSEGFELCRLQDC